MTMPYRAVDVTMDINTTQRRSVRGEGPSLHRAARTEEEERSF